MEPLSPSRIVRFDTECVLIPDAQPTAKLPFVLTKSYSLPLWRKDVEDESRLVIKVPIPQFRRRASRSPGPHARAASTSPVVPRAPLPSCLVHQHQDPGPSAAPLSPVRRPAPGPSSPPLSCPPPLTVPLRPCCAACEAATDDALAGGDAWKIHFTRGAKRRRSASLEQPLAAASPFAALADVDTPVRTFAALSAAIDGTLPIVRGGAAVATAFALRVDEVDQRRRAFSFSHEEEHYAALRRHAGSPPPPPPIVPLASSAAAISPSPVSPVPVHPYASLLAPEGYRLRASPIAEEDSDARGSSLSLASAHSSTRSASGQSTRSTGSGSARALGKGRAPRRANTAVAPPPGADEDDADLFPLPRRSPSGTPSPRASPSPRGSPVLGSFGGYFASASPSASTSSLAVPSSDTRHKVPEVRSASAGGGVLGPSLSRRVGATLRIHTAGVTPPVLPPTPAPTTTTTTTAKSAATPPTTPAGTTAPSPTAPVPIPTTPTLSPVRRPTSPRGPRAPFALPLVPSAPPETPTARASRHAHTQSSGSNSSRSKSPRSSPGAAHEHRRAHSIAAALRGAGADVLRGVGGLGGVGVGSV
ncbi:hypothetical protein HYPSUDRAFT_523809 [Hypholoma sublateritium FD-334 SS-4]|uniref:Uncharacterized protein n=1 Tax=Hypholoma sublateritium (strain FD-334 SS-4) TaxID=945553 RepID=A0A0D2QCZ6_HYPSF|nr:hypothetical protein HYPSUDRAFT_523809 [Hypholoma sublateritium FD-334 SS-4]